MPVNLPPDVVKVLSFHGVVEVFGGTESRPRERAGCAPFDDRVALFLQPTGPVAESLSWSSQLDVQARHPDGDYSLRMVGRAHLGVAVSRDTDRHALEPWLPEGVRGGSRLATWFVPEHIELVRSEGDEKVRYHGPTPAGQSRLPAPVLWVRAATSGAAMPGAISAFVGPFVWLGVQGVTYPARGVAAVVSIASAMALIAGVRLAVLPVAYARYRTGKLALSEAVYVGEGLLAPLLAQAVGGVLVGMGLLGVLVCRVVWEPLLAWVAFGASLAWLLGPVWLVHFGTSRRTGRESPS